MNSNEFNATSNKELSKEFENINDLQNQHSAKSLYIISETIDTQIDHISKERVRTAPPISPNHGSITQNRFEKAKNTIPIDSQSQTNMKDQQDHQTTENIQESSLESLNVPISSKKEEKTRENQSFKPKGGIAMFQSKELFQVISMRQTNQNSTIRDNLKRIEEQIKESSKQETIKDNESERPKLLEGCQNSQINFN